MAKLTLQDIANLQNESTVVTTLKSNNDLTEIAMEDTLSRDGQSPNQMLSNLDMNNYKIINLPDALTDQEPATYSQLNAATGAIGSGAVINADYVTLSNNATLLNERVLTGSSNISITDGGPGTTATIAVSDNELKALATTTAAADKLPYFNGATTATTTDFTPYARTLVDDADATTARATLGAVIGTNVQAWDTDLDAVAGVSTAGLLARTGAGTAAARTLTAPAAGFTITNPAGTAGDPTFVLANDLAAVEGLSGTGLVTHTAANTMVERTLTAPAAGITITNPAGIAGNPTLVLANDLAAYEGLAANGMVARTATDTAAVRTITGTANEITLTNGDGVASNPTVSIPSAVTFTGKTITGGTYSSPIISSISNTGTVTFPTATDTLVGKATTDTLTNKSISGATNTLSAVPLSAHANQNAFTFVGNNTGSAAAPTAVDIATLTTKASPAGTDYLILSDQAASGAWKKATVSTVGAGATVSSIAGNTGAFTLSTGITNSVNDIQLAVPVTAQNGGTGVVSPANHTIPISQGASPQTNTGTGVAGQYLISGGASAHPLWATGGRVLLNTLTASNSATLGDTTSLTATYSAYEIFFDEILAATNGVNFMLQIRSGGSFQTTGYIGNYFGFSNGSTTNITGAATTFIPLIGSSAFTNTRAGSGWIRVANPSVSAKHMFNGQVAYGGSSYAGNSIFAGMWDTAGVIDGFQILMSAGNITSGTVRIYGFN